MYLCKHILKVEFETTCTYKKFHSFTFTIFTQQKLQNKQEKYQ